MVYTDVLKKIKNRQLSPIYLLYGTETYFMQNLQKQITELVLTENDIENLATYDLSETPIQDVIADVETYPFFGERKLVIANNPTFLKAKPDKLSFDHNLDVLAHYLEHPVEHSILVFVAAYEKIDERKKIAKLLKKHGTIANCSPMKEQDIPKWIKSQANQMHIKIEPDAFDVIEGELSADLRQLQNELEKLALYVGEGGTVTKETADNLLSHTSHNSSLRLVDAVIERNIQRAVTIYKDLAKMNEEPIALIALLAFQFRTILRVKLLKQKGYSQAQMQKNLSVHPYVIKIAYTRADKFSLDALQTIIHRLAEADSSIKQGKMEKDLAFELLLYDLIQTK